MNASREPSISDLLLQAGYGHRRTERTTNNYSHEVFRLSDGEVIGDMTAHQACEFLETIAG